MHAERIDSAVVSSVDSFLSGAGLIETRRVAGQTRVVRLSNRAPLKLLVPRHHGDAVSAYASTYGGGLLAGDSIDLSVECGAGTALLLRSQSATKIYRSGDGGTARQRLCAVVNEGATLLSLPDPVTCFAGARYAQAQSIDLRGGASVLLLDWLTNGRSARGETWAFDRFESRTDVRRDGKSIFLDATRLDRDDLPLASHFRGGRFACLATLVLTGPRFADESVTLRADVDTMFVSRHADLLASTSVIAGDGLLVRLAAISTQRAMQWIMPRLQFLSRLTGDDPFGRKW